ncbi:MAG: matrixin family metalloprotease [Bdellovibrionales bacterium]|nr:matrixin family metalloprotease [Bdellovibrionales bacterium]
MNKACVSLLTFSLLYSAQTHAFSTIPWKGVPARIPDSTDIAVEVDDRYGQYFPNSGCDEAGDCKTPFMAIKNAISTWQSVSGIKLAFTSIKSKRINNRIAFDGVNQIKMIHSNWGSQPGSPPSSALAVTISTYEDPQDIVDFDIIVNADNQRWADINDHREYNFHDFQSVLTHEIGHGLGLDHSSTNSREGLEELRDATMFFAAGMGETHQRSLGQDDIHGIRHLYTSTNFSTPSITLVTPDRLDATMQSRSIVEIQGSDFTATTAVYILQNQSAPDVVGRVINVESDKIDVAFDLSYLPTGTYSVLVANSYNRFTKVKDVLEINNPNGITLSNANYGRLAQTSACKSNGAPNVSLLCAFLCALWILSRRKKFVMISS